MGANLCNLGADRFSLESTQKGPARGKKRQIEFHQNVKFHILKTSLRAQKGNPQTGKKKVYIHIYVSIYTHTSYIQNT